MKQLDKTTQRDYYECICDSEMLSLTYENDPQYQYVEIAMWSRGMTGFGYSITSRLRHIWHIIRTGTPHSDQIVLQKEDFKKLKDFINSIKIDGE